MLFSLHYITAAAIVLTGLYVLYQGDWRPFKLKYAAVVLSTLAAIWLLIFTAKQGSGGCKSEAIVCLSYSIYGIIRNIAFVLFHISVGRDAISYKKRDRRKVEKKVTQIPRRKKVSNG